MRTEFLDALALLVDYWSEVDASTRYKLDGLAFSFLNILDGTSFSAPGYHIVPLSDENGIAYSKEMDENWYPLPDLKNDIAKDMLHEAWSLRKKENKNAV